MKMFKDINSLQKLYWKKQLKSLLEILLYFLVILCEKLATIRTKKWFNMVLPVLDCWEKFFINFKSI